MRMPPLAPFRRFARDVRGSMSAEAVVILPLLIGWIVISMSFFEAYHMRNLNLRGAYTVSDLLSRHMNGDIDATYIEGLDDVFSFLTSTDDDLTAIRVTVVYCEDNCDADDTEARVLNRDWSYSTHPNLDPLQKADLNAQFQDDIPISVKNERAIMVESYLHFIAPFNVGIDPVTMESLVVTRPRFSGYLGWDDGTS